MIVAGLDVGTTSVKGLALDSETGNVVAGAEEGYPFAAPRPGWAEQDPELWWAAASSVLGRLGSVDGIGLTGQMHGLVALDDSGSVLRPALLWNDQRTATETAEIEERLGGVSGAVRLTGNRAMTGFTAPKLLWMARHEPALFSRVRTVMLPKDYVRFRLGAGRATDVTDASGTGWFDVASRAWSTAVLDALDIDASVLPPALESAELSGHTADRGVPVAAGAGDQPAGALGVGITGAGGTSSASVVLGTSGVVFGALPSYAADPAGRLQASCHAVPGGWFAMGVMLSAAGSLGWLQRVTGGAPFEELVAEAARWDPGVEGLTFLPYLTGERTPHFDADARGAFAGLEVRHDRGALTRAVLEGVAFGLRDALDLLRELGSEVTVGRVSGGGARSELWLRIVASALEIPLERVAVEEGAAYGAALLGGVAAGAWGSVEEAGLACVRAREAIEPVAEWIEPMREARERYRELYPALRG